jgi:transposase
MIPEAREVHLSRKDRKVLEACCRSPMTLQRDLKRARIVLLAADGRSTRSIAKEVGVQPRIVSLWRHRYADQGLEGLQDKPRPGKQPIYTKATDKRILKLLDKPPPEGFARWTGPLLAGALGDAHLADKPANLQRHRWSTATTSRSRAPIQSKTGAVPAHYGIGSDNCKCIVHLGKQPADTSQYQPVNRRKSKSLGTGTPQHIDLLPQQQNLRLEHCARPQQIDHCPNDQFAQMKHRAAASPDSRSTASRLDLR